MSYFNGIVCTLCKGDNHAEVFAETIPAEAWAQCRDDEYIFAVKYGAWLNARIPSPFDKVDTVILLYPEYDLGETDDG